jgi:purine-binding chemotaxis protein CheW
MKALVASEAQETQQYLTFLLDDQEYGLEIFKIREIRGYAPITPIPNVPAHVRGVMNLRGTVLPVVDLRTKFQLPTVEYNKFTVIVIATVADQTVGLLVDAVSDVLTVARDALRDPPDFGSTVNARFISGMIQSGERLAVLLNLEELLTEGDLVIPGSAEQAALVERS